jgi:hypothetical protein
VSILRYLGGYVVLIFLGGSGCGSGLMSLKQVY